MVSNDFLSSQNGKCYRHGVAFLKNELCVKIVHGLVKPKLVFVTAVRHSLITLQLSEKWPQSFRGTAVYNKLK